MFEINKEWKVQKINIDEACYIFHNITSVDFLQKSSLNPHVHYGKENLFISMSEIFFHVKFHPTNCSF